MFWSHCDQDPKYLGEPCSISERGVGLALLPGLWALGPGPRVLVHPPHSPPRVAVTPPPPAVWVSVFHLSLSFLLCLEWLFSIYFLFNSSHFLPGSWILHAGLQLLNEILPPLDCSPATTPPPASQQALASGFHLLGGSLGVSRFSWTKHILPFNHSFGL